MNNVGLIGGHVDENNTPILRSKDTLRQLDYTTSLIDIFEWAKELDVVLSIGYYDMSDTYMVNISKGQIIKTVFITSKMIKRSRTGIYDEIANAAKEVKDAFMKDLCRK